MAELASDTIFNILSRLPVKSLACFRCVSKRWCAYIDDYYLGIIHDERAVEELAPIMYDVNVSCIVGFNIIKSEEGNTTLEAKSMSLESELSKSCSRYREYLAGGSTNRGYLVGGSCNGLLYLSLDDITHVTSLAVIHPLRKEFYKLPPMQRLLGGLYYLTEESRGLGFDVSTNTFKMVCVLLRREFSKSETISKDLCTMVHVLGMNSSWREIPRVPPYPIQGDGIFAHGCLYWLAPNYEPKSKSRGELICFDVRNEEFTTICPPEKICGYSVTYQLVDLHGEVGYAYFHKNNNIFEVWILKQKQWAKHCQFNIKPPLTGYMKVLGRWNKDGDLLIKTYTIGNNLLVYCLKSGLLEEVNIVGMKYELLDTYTYMYPASSMFSIRGIDQQNCSFD